MMKCLFGLTTIVMMGLMAAEAEEFPVRVNQAGYRPGAVKICSMVNPPQKTYYVQKGDTDICWHTIWEGEWKPDASGRGLMIGDFSHITEPGDYRILCGGTNGIARFRMPDYRVWAQRSFDWVLGANMWNRSYVEGIGQNQWQRPVFGQFFPSTPQIPGGVLHVANGEYDMPPGAMLLWASAELK